MRIGNPLPEFVIIKFWQPDIDSPQRNYGLKKLRVRGYDLAQNFLEHAGQSNPEAHYQEVVFLEPGLDRHTVRLDGSEKLKAHAIILATGGSPRKLEIPGEDKYCGKGVPCCAVCDGYFFRNKTVASVGGGGTAAEEKNFEPPHNFSIGYQIKMTSISMTEPGDINK